MTRDNFRRERDPDTGRLMHVWEEYDGDVGDTVTVSIAAEEDDGEADDGTSSRELAKTGGTTPKIVTGEVMLLETNKSWPATTARGEPIATSIVNVIWFCEQIDIQAKFNEFDRLCSDSMLAHDPV
jgi:hypothetical protein